MFNRGAFNRQKFNRPRKNAVEVSVELSSTADISSDIKRSRPAYSDLSCGATIDINTTRHVYVESMNVTSGAVLAATDVDIVKIFSAILKSGADLSSESTARFVIKQIELGGSASIEAQNILRKYGTVEMAAAAIVEAAAIISKPIVANLIGGASIAVTATLRRFVEMDILAGGSDAISHPALHYNGETRLLSGAILEPSAHIRIFSQVYIAGGSAIDLQTSTHYGAGTELAAVSDIYVDFEAAQKEVMEVTITLNPGDIFVLDTCQYTATLNGENVLEQVLSQGYDWIQLHPETESLIVEAVGNSELNVKVNAVPRWL